jgi:hypothetical protein
MRSASGVHNVVIAWYQIRHRKPRADLGESVQGSEKNTSGKSTAVGRAGHVAAA